MGDESTNRSSSTVYELHEDGRSSFVRGDHEEQVILSPVTFMQDDPNHDIIAESTFFLDEDQDVVVQDTSFRTVASQPLLRQSSSSYRARPSRNRLNGLNYLNAITYAAHVFVSWGIGVWGLGGIIETRWEIMEHHITLINPAHWNYFLWAPILLLEFVFAVAQLFPYYRSRPIIQAGTRYNFFLVFVSQTFWTIFFSFKLFIASFVSVLTTLLLLINLLVSQRSSLTREKSIAEYILFRLCFYMHTGWMILMTVDHFSLLFRRFHTSVGLQVAVDIFALGAMLAVAVCCLARPPTNDFVIPCVILWAYLGIASNLANPSESFMNFYHYNIIEALRYSTYFFASSVGLLLAPNLLVWFTRECCTINVVQLED